jgi:hypothetical protein
VELVDVGKHPGVIGDDHGLAWLGAALPQELAMPRDRQCQGPRINPVRPDADPAAAAASSERNVAPE